MLLCFSKVWNDLFKMTETVNKFLLTGDKFMPEIHFRQPRFTYRSFVPFTKHCERIQKLKEIGDLNYKDKLGKA